MHAYLSSTLGLAVAVLTATLASAKPEQIRSVTDPIFHLYLQAYPQDREFALSLFLSSLLLF